jgi:hypothetical protein
VRVDAVEEVVVAKGAGRPAQVGVPAGVGDRVAERARVDHQADLLVDLPRDGGA